MSLISFLHWSGFQSEQVFILSYLIFFLFRLWRAARISSFFRWVNPPRWAPKDQGEWDRWFVWQGPNGGICEEIQVITLAVQKYTDIWSRSDHIVMFDVNYGFATFSWHRSCMDCCWNWHHAPRDHPLIAHPATQYVDLKNTSINHTVCRGTHIYWLNTI